MGRAISRGGRVLAFAAISAGFLTAGAPAYGAGWTGEVTVDAEERITQPHAQKDLLEDTTWYFNGNATVVQDGQGRAVQWNQEVEYSTRIYGEGTRDDICNGNYREEYSLSGSIRGGYGSARVIFGFPGPTPEPQPLPVEVEVTSPTPPLTLMTTPRCDDEVLTSSTETVLPCRVTLGEEGPGTYPTFSDRYDTATITDFYDADPGGFLCDSAYTFATVNMQLTRLPDGDCDGVPNGQDPTGGVGECGTPQPPFTQAQPLANTQAQPLAKTGPKKCKKKQKGLAETAKKKCKKKK